MKKLNTAETKQASGGDNLDGVSCECWKIIGLMGFLTGTGHSDGVSKTILQDGMRSVFPNLNLQWFMPVSN